MLIIFQGGRQYPDFETVKSHGKIRNPYGDRLDLFFKKSTGQRKRKGGCL